MSHLKDMEELLFSIGDTNSRDYMKESMACYMAGAYRASVVLSFIALFDDILKKLGELGAVNSKAKGIFDTASKKRDNQEIFESYLIDQLKSNALLSSLDAEFLEKLRWFRNKAAHPSGHHSSAEEARYVFAEATQRFLSRPILSTTQLADEVLISLSDTNFFPSNKIEVIKEVVQKSLINLHGEAYPYLIAKLLDKKNSSSKELKNNCVSFLSGMARLNDKEINECLKKYVIVKKASSNDFGVLIITLMGSNGELFNGLDDVTYGRLQVLIRERIENIKDATLHTILMHPVNMFISLFSKCSSEFVLEKLDKEFNEFLKKFIYSAKFLKNIGRHKLPLDAVIHELIQRAGSNDFTTANEFVENIGEIDKLLGDSFSQSEAFEIIFGVMSAAIVGAFGAIDVRNAYFNVAPKLRGKAKEYFLTDSVEAERIAKGIVGANQDVNSLFKYLDPRP